ncbi:MAG: phosphatase family protein [Flaviaesturariibacter sp.]|nr:phosphatase family protein [Flaviaesturariibacter sp.]
MPELDRASFNAIAEWAWRQFCNNALMDAKDVKETRKLSLKIILVPLLFIIALFVFAFLAHTVVFKDEDLFDEDAFQFFKGYTTPAVVEAMRILSFFGSPRFFLPAYTILVLFFIFRRQRRYALDIAIVGISSTVLMFGLKDAFKRQRPDFPLLDRVTNYSFPSGHALCSFIFCSVLIYIVWNTHWRPAVKWLLSALFFLFAVSIGISRIVLRYHYASDVLAGICLGFAWAILCMWLLKRIGGGQRAQQRVEAK